MSVLKNTSTLNNSIYNSGNLADDKEHASAIIKQTTMSQALSSGHIFGEIRSGKRAIMFHYIFFNCFLLSSLKLI